MTKAHVIVAVIFVMTSCLVVVAMCESNYWDWHAQGHPVATDTIHVPEQCLPLALSLMRGEQEAELNAYDARHVETRLVACGAHVSHLK